MIIKQHILLYFFTLTVGVWAGVAPLFAQEHVTLRGRIIDQETSQPIAGATISIKENERSGSALSGSEGGFTIRAHVNQTIVVTNIGYLPKAVKVTGGQETLLISLVQDSRELSEVVVTGALGIKRSARELGTSAQTVDNAHLNQGHVFNPLLALASKVSSLRINASDATSGKTDPTVQVRLRGTRSFNRSQNDPIYVVDGVPIPEIGRLNPNDIESVTVLKGANAAALYGSEGVNGAIMITTKSGTRGRGAVQFNNATTFSDVFLLPPAQTEFGQGQNGQYSPTTAESWGPRFDGTMRPFGTPINGVQPEIRYSAPGRDNRLDFFDTGVTTQNDVSFSGGDEKSTYFLSVQDIRIKGVIPGDKSARTGARFNGSRNFGKLNTAYSVNYIHFDRNTTPDGPWASVYTQPANLDWNQFRNWEDPDSPAHPLNWYNTVSGTKNPFFMAGNTRNTAQQQTLTGRIELDYQFTDWFKAIYRLGYYSTNEDTRATTGKMYSPVGARNVNGSVNDGSESFRRLNNDLILRFNKDFGPLSTRLLVGQNVRMDDTKAIGVSASNLLLDGLFNPGSRIGELDGSASITQYRSLGTYGEFTAGYQNYLFLTLTGRYDQVSVLSKANRGYFYPGVSTSFVFTDAIRSLSGSRVINYGKVYASFNRTGNVTLSPYSLNNAYSQSGGFPYGALVGFLPSLTNPNENIEPEFVTSYEAGFQLGLFDSRLNIDAAYVYSDSDGQIFTALSSSATGYNNSIVNAGRLTNSIIELSVNGEVVRNNQVRWNIGFNFSYTDNQVKELYSGSEFRIFRQSYAIIGQPYPTLKVSDYARDPQGRIIVDENGNTSTVDDNTILGTMVPPYLIGLNSSIDYKGFQLGLQFDARLGGWIYSETVPRMYTAGTHPATVAYGREPFVMPNTVVDNGDGTYSPNTSIESRGDKAFWQSQGNVQINTAAKGDYVKLRELNLSYTFPRSWLANQRVISGARIGVIANNLFIIRHSSNTLGDAESLYNQTDGYLSFRQIPPSRTYGFNVNVTF
ncbi:SusC/RagA family TonB-linked outer membrane protein [Parapedobacter deserti]|uniref:SusC/RagA family TonB-linked outer membrane protein n=1 Tax=Parapedobacter deserti TaxID=1912957 RepID=A0ABV7JI74_9SPHI